MNVFKKSTNLLFIIFCLSILLLNGCGAGKKKMALLPQMKSVDVSKESLALLTVKISNEYKPGHQPDIYSVTIRREEEDAKREFFEVTEKEKYNEVKDSYNEYLISFKLSSGKYILRHILARRHIPLLVKGAFVVPMFSSFSMEPNKVIYLGHIDATVKERIDDNMLRAGSVIPLIDQSVIGASGGTFVVNITDRYEDDIKLFQEKFPYLLDHRIENCTLPQWTQPKDLWNE